MQECRRRCAALEQAVSERDSTAEELRAEGEKLSREQLKLNTVIKRLRAKEREQEAAGKKLELVGGGLPMSRGQWGVTVCWVNY